MTTVVGSEGKKLEQNKTNKTKESRPGHGGQCHGLVRRRRRKRRNENSSGSRNCNG